MNLSLATRGGVALAVLLAASATARAELIPWTYNWSRSPAVIKADSPGTGTINLSDEVPHTAAGNSDIVATNLRTFSTATSKLPDRFTNAKYTLGLNLFDIDAQVGGTVTFTGELNGTMTATSANIKNTFTGQLTQKLVLGHHLYIVTIGPYTPPGPTGSANAGSISAHALIRVVTLPEPGTLALSCLGVALLGVRRRRQERGHEPGSPGARG
jgi:hypothetical protein